MIVNYDKIVQISFFFNIIRIVIIEFDFGNFFIFIFILVALVIKYVV